MTKNQLLLNGFHVSLTSQHLFEQFFQFWCSAIKNRSQLVITNFFSITCLPNRLILRKQINEKFQNNETFQFEESRADHVYLILLFPSIQLRSSTDHKSLLFTAGDKLNWKVSTSFNWFGFIYNCSTFDTIIENSRN